MRGRISAHRGRTACAKSKTGKDRNHQALGLVADHPPLNSRCLQRVENLRHAVEKPRVNDEALLITLEKFDAQDLETLVLWL